MANYASSEETNDAAVDREKSCLSKLTWRSRELAAAAAALAAYSYGDGSDKPSPYRCRHCNMWHLARA